MIKGLPLPRGNQYPIVFSWEAQTLAYETLNEARKYRHLPKFNLTEDQEKELYDTAVWLLDSRLVDGQLRADAQNWLHYRITHG